MNCAPQMCIRDSKYDDMITGLTNIFDLCENAAQHCKKLAKKFAEDFKDDKMIYFIDVYKRQAYLPSWRKCRRES